MNIDSHKGVPPRYTGDPEGGPLEFSRGRTQEYLQAVLVFVLLAGGLYICIRLAAPFFTPLVAALILAVLLEPVYRLIKRWTGLPSVASGTTVAVAMIGIFVPIIFLLTELVSDAAQGAAGIKAGIEGAFIMNTLSAHPKIALAVSWILERIDLQGLVSEGAARLTNWSASLLSMSARQTAGALLTFYLLFYFLRDQRRALVAVRGFLPFTGEESAQIQKRLMDTIHATIFSTVVTGVIQGVLGGAIFAIAGVPAALFLGLLVGLVAILPVLGTIFVWLPAVALIALDGDWLRAFAIAAAFLAIGIMDSFLYSALVGNRLRLHGALTFVSVIGGLLLFGPTGFVLGPLIIAVTLAIKDILRDRMRASFV